MTCNVSNLPGVEPCTSGIKAYLRFEHRHDDNPSLCNFNVAMDEIK